MVQSNILDDYHLKKNLRMAIAKNCEVESYADGDSALHCQCVSGIDVRAGQRTIALLSQQLWVWTSLSNPTDSQSLGRLMADVASIASHIGLQVTGPPAETLQLDLLKHRIRADFALICSLSIAHSQGYSIPLEQFPWQVMSSAVMTSNDNMLVRMFREFIAISRQISGPRHVRRNHERTKPVLSPESYWNLVSVAELEEWDDSVVRRLIEEYLDPAPHPYVVCYSHTVSAAEWRQLFDWIYGLTDSHHAISGPD